jgi:hypothetical protein
MKVELTNGSIIQIIGTDKIINVGINPIGCIYSETALQSPKAWDFTRPILRENGGWAIFNSTPRGKNWFYELYTMANENEEWFASKLGVSDTGVISPSDIDQERAEGMSEDLIQQEYYCSFDRGVEGSYYGRLVEQMYQEGRIGRVPYDPSVAVDTYWDLGYGDSTAIVFVQYVGREVHVIDYYEAHGEGLTHYAKLIQSKPYVYGSHYGPHDIEAGHLSIGKSLRQYASELGLRFLVVPRTDIEYGIECVRGLLPLCYIDDSKCKHLIKCLENYSKTYNDKMSCYSNTPKHDWSSHGSDSFRYLSTAYRTMGKSNGGLTKDKIKEMRERNVLSSSQPNTFPNLHT